MADVAQSSPARRGGGGIAAAIPSWLVALLTGTLFTISLITQLSTNEAWVAHISNINVWHPSLGVLWQIPDLIGGKLSPDQTGPVVAAWILEAMLLAITVGGINLIHQAVHNGGLFMGVFFELVAIAGLGFNFYTDYLYGTISPGQESGHVLFALLNSVCVSYFGVISWFCVRDGWSRV